MLRKEVEIFSFFSSWGQELHLHATTNQQKLSLWLDTIFQKNCLATLRTGRERYSTLVLFYKNCKRKKRVNPAS